MSGYTQRGRYLFDSAGRVAGFVDANGNEQLTPSLVSAAASPAAMAMRAISAGARTRPIIALGIGDSHFMGYGSGTAVGGQNFGNALINAPFHSLPVEIQNIGEFEVVNTAMWGDCNCSSLVAGSYPQLDPRVTFGSGVSAHITPTGLGGRLIAMAPTSGYLTINFGRPIDSFELHAACTSSFSGSVEIYASDDSYVGYANTFAASAQIKRQLFSSQKFRDGIVKIKNASTTATAYLGGAIAWDSQKKQIIVVNASYSGGKTGDLLSTANPWEGTGFLATIQPDATFIALTINDFLQSTASATYRSNLTTIAEAASLHGSVDIMTGALCASANSSDYDRWNTGVIGTTRGVEIVRACRDVAASVNGQFLDLHQYYGSHPAMIAAGYATADYAHQTAAGYAYQRRAIAQMVSRRLST